MTTLFRILSLIVVMAWTTLGFAADVPPLTGVFNDPSNVVSAQKRTEIIAFLREQEARTSNQIVVLVVKSLDGDTIESFADRVFRSWKLGIAGKDNGVLMLVVSDEKKARIEVGRGLQGALPDVLANRILSEHAVANFKVRKFGSAILESVQAIDTAVKSEYPPEQKVKKDEPTSFGFIVFIVVFGGILALVIGKIIFGGSSKEEERTTSTSRSGRTSGARYASASSSRSRSRSRDEDSGPMFVPIPVSTGGGYHSRSSSDDDSSSRSSARSEPAYEGSGGKNDGGGASISVSTDTGGDTGGGGGGDTGGGGGGGGD